MNNLEIIQEILKNKNKEDYKYRYKEDINIFHLIFYKDAGFSINNFDFGFLEFKAFLTNLIS